MGRLYTFREILDKSELKRLFNLRYRIYEKCRMQTFLKRNAKKIDIDCFDIHSHHYGLFEKNKIAGYLRIVTDRETYCNPDVLEIGVKSNEFQKNAFVDNKIDYTGYTEYPFLSYPGVPTAVKKYYDSVSKKYPVIEASRLIIPEDHRCTKKAIALIECAIIAGMQLIDDAIGVAFIHCCKSHEKAYQFFGFKRLPHVPEYQVFDVNLSGMALSLSFSNSLCRSDIPPRFHPRLYPMLEEYLATGQISKVL